MHRPLKTAYHHCTIERTNQRKMLCLQAFDSASIKTGSVFQAVSVERIARAGTARFGSPPSRA
jgi:hypothetical protein